MEVEDKAIQAASAPTTPDAPVRRQDSSSVTMSSSSPKTPESVTLDDVTYLAESDISEPLYCEAVDMLRFLFSFCNTSGDASEVEPKDKDFKYAFDEVQKLANTQKSPLMRHLDQAINAVSEASMYPPLIKAFNYALDELSRLEVPGLPHFQESHQIVFARNNQNHTASKCRLQGSHKPDIVLIRWVDFEKQRKGAEIPFSESHDSDVCCMPAFSISWRNVLSTLEVEPSASKLSEDSEEKPVDKPGAEGNCTRHIEDFGGPASPEMIREGCLTCPSSPKILKRVGPALDWTTLPDLKKRKYTDQPGTLPTRVTHNCGTKGEEPSIKSAEEPSSRSEEEMSSESEEEASSESGEDTSSKREEETLSEHGEETSSESGEETPNEGGEEAKGPEKPPKHPPRVQSALYAAHRASSSFDITHAVNIILIGTSVHITWIDRESVIESRVIDLIDDLTSVLLLLLILQRFDSTKWGYFAECPQSGVKMDRGKDLLTASFVAGERSGQATTVDFYPEDHAICLPGTKLIGRCTSVIGGRRGPIPDPLHLGNKRELQDGNDIAVKIYWPEEARTSEVDVLEKAEKYGRNIDFIKNHIPEVVCHRDPNFLCSSTKTIRKFLGLPTDGCRRLRIIAFRRLQSIMKLKEKEMLAAYLDCFFCHFCLWRMGIQHGDISLGNLMWDDERKAGVLNDFDLAKFADQTGASRHDYTGTLPFMALDLMSEKGLRGEIPRLYRHEAESFAWILIYLYLATVEGEGQKNYMRTNKLLAWLVKSSDMKRGLDFDDSSDHNISLAYTNAKNLARNLHKYWLDRYYSQFARKNDDAIRSIIAQKVTRMRKTTGSSAPYVELADEEVFQEVVAENMYGLLGLEAFTKVTEMNEKYRSIDW